MKREKWMLLRMQDGVDWRGMEGGTEAVVLEGGEEWALFG